MGPPDRNAAFVAELLRPIADVLCVATMEDTDLREKAAVIAEAFEKFEHLTAAHNAWHFGSRERAVQNIMLDWSEWELAIWWAMLAECANVAKRNHAAHAVPLSILLASIASLPRPAFERLAAGIIDCIDQLDPDLDLKDCDEGRSRPATTT